MLTTLSATDQKHFPPLHTATVVPDGLLAVGGDLSVERLTAAYQQGIFPWFADDEPILWWSPYQRCVLNLERQPLYRPKRLQRWIKRHHADYRITFDQAFDQVIHHCAQRRLPVDLQHLPSSYNRDTTNTWITDEMQQAYQRLHQTGMAHSIEIWRDEHLVGGVYGVDAGTVFSGESMFSFETNVSKLALLTLATHCQHWGYRLLDGQVVSQHLLSLGFEVLPRPDFIRMLSLSQNTIADWRFQSSLLFEVPFTPA